MKFYIFLDIDGVLNNENYTALCYMKHHKAMYCNDIPFDSRNLEVLKYLCDNLAYDVKIILSSSWRLRQIDYEIVNSRLAEYGLEVYDKTPTINMERGVEIKEFLKDNKYADFLILDDEDFDIKDIFPNKLIKVNPKTGLTYQDIEDVLLQTKGV